VKSDDDGAGILIFGVGLGDEAGHRHAVDEDNAWAWSRSGGDIWP
jgi:hypothetical protein